MRETIFLLLNRKIHREICQAFHRDIRIDSRLENENVVLKSEYLIRLRMI